MFSKYDVYTTTQSIYCYPDSNVLKNKLNIRDNKLLKTAEEEITLIKQMELLKNPIKGNFSKAHLMNIHKFIFEDIYSFAGKIRREQISKADTMFYPPNLIDREIDKVFAKIKEKNMLRETDEEKVLIIWHMLWQSLTSYSPSEKVMVVLFVNLSALWQSVWDMT